MNIISIEELKSWLRTLTADLIVEAILGISTGILSLLDGAGLTKAGLVALGSAVAVATVRTLLKAVIAKLQTLRKK